MKTKQTHFSCMFSKFTWWKTNIQGTRKHILLWLYNSNGFLLDLTLLCLSCLILFCLFIGSIFKVKSSFWYYDVSTSPFLFLMLAVIYTFVLYLYAKIRYINFWYFSYHLFHQIFETENKDRNKKSPADFLSVFISLIIDINHYFSQ